MQLLGGAGLLFVALAINFLDTTEGNRSRKADPLEIKLNLLRQDLKDMRSELLLEDEEQRNKTENLERTIAALRHAVNELKPENLQKKIVLQDLQDPVKQQRERKSLTRLRQRNQDDMKALKKKVRRHSAKIASLQAAAAHNHTTQADRLSDLQLQAAGLKCEARGLKCGPCMPGFPGENGEPDASSDSGEPDRSWENGTHTVAKLRLTQAYGEYKDRVVIEAGGSAVCDGPVRTMYTIVRTDGLFADDLRRYWEAELVWSLACDLRFSGYWEVGSVAVRREGSDFGNWPGVAVDQSSAVGILYHFRRKTWWYRCIHDGREVFNSQPVRATSKEIRHRLGFMLDPGDRTLTTVDVNTNTRICSFPVPAGDPEPQPLVPVVWFWADCFQRRFSLPAVDPSRLPGAVTDL